MQASRCFRRHLKWDRTFYHPKKFKAPLTEVSKQNSAEGFLVTLPDTQCVYTYLYVKLTTDRRTSYVIVWCSQTENKQSERPGETSLIWKNLAFSDSFLMVFPLAVVRTEMAFGSVLYRISSFFFFRVLHLQYLPNHNLLLIGGKFKFYILMTKSPHRHSSEQGNRMWTSLYYIGLFFFFFF